MALPLLALLVALAVADDVISNDVTAGDDVSTVREPGRCVAYGVCESSGLPCPSNTPAQPVEAATLATIATLCPHLSSEELFCCDTAQVSALSNQLQRAAIILSGCENCYRNFRSVFCDMVCHPNQSEFLDVTETAESGGVAHVIRFSYYITRTYAVQMYESCKKFPLALCMGFFSCTLEETYDFLGDNSYTKLKTDYFYGETTPEPFKPPSSDHLTTCDFYQTWDRCSCSNCEAACNNLGQDGLTHAADTCVSRTLGTSRPPTVETSPVAKDDTSQGCRDTVAAYCPTQQEEGTVCCDETGDVSGIFEKIDQLFSACQNCHSNIKNLMCTFLYSKDQSLLVNVETSEDGTEVTGVKLVLTTELQEVIFSSCAGVTAYSATCQDRNCSLQTLLDDVTAGSPLNIAPIIFIHDFSESPYKIPAEGYLRCNTAGPGRCSCEECPESCGASDGYTHTTDNCILTDANWGQTQFYIKEIDSFGVTDSLRTTLGTTCPLYPIEGKTCCSRDSMAVVTTIAESLKQMASCVVCGENLAALVCHVFCSPDQSLSLVVNEKEEGSWDTSAEKISVYISPEMIAEITTSCSADDKLLTSLCPEGSDCTDPTVFLTKLSEKIEESGVETLVTLFTEEDLTDIEPLTATVTRCEETNPALGEACPCETCSKSCGPDGYSHGAGLCLMYGTCKATMEGKEERDYPCLGNEKSVAQTEEIANELAGICPLYTAEYGERPVCCDQSTITMMEGLLNLAKALSCPNCYHNLAKLFCNVFCNPDQSLYNVARETAKEGDTVAIPSFGYYVEEKIAAELWTSCKGDQSGIIPIICQMKYSRECENSLEFVMALGENEVTSFTIEFEFAADAPLQLDSPGLVACEETFNGESCECKDCIAACGGDIDDTFPHERGVCLVSPITGLINGTAAVKGPAVNTVCPDLAGEMVCCSETEFGRLSEALEKIEDTIECAACVNNIKRLACTSICGGDQSLHTTLHQARKIVTAFIDTVDVEVLYESCAYYTGSDLTDQDAVLDMIANKLSVVYEGEFTMKINKDAQRLANIVDAALHGQENCYDEGPNRCDCKYCKESCARDGYLHSANKCLLYDICEGDYPCVNVTDPVIPTGALSSKLAQFCPQYTGSAVCCTEEQLDSFGTRVSAAKTVIGGCPACYSNFVAVFCRMMCDPDQSQFMQVVRTTDDRTAERLKYHISDDFAARTYNSCANVRSGSGTRAINIICDSVDCGLNEFYQSLGINKYTDLRVYYEVYTPGDDSAKSQRYEGTGQSPVTGEDVRNCQDEVNGQSCSCVDCPAACDEDDEPLPIDDKNYIIYFIPLAVVSWITLTIVVFTIVRYRISYNGGFRLESKDVKMEKMGEKEKKIEGEDGEEKGAQQPRPNPVQAAIRGAFGAWSDVVYRYPLLVILGCVLMVGAACVGLNFFTITYDPVELWTAPSSQSRINKEYFEKTFGTPYRVAQVIFSEKNPGEQFVVEGVVEGKEKNLTFSSIFRKDKMSEIYQLEEKIKEELVAGIKINSTTEVNISLADVCYKPLGEHDEEDAINNCVIMSPFQWDFSNYEGEMVYLDDDDDDDPTFEGTYLEQMMCGQKDMSPSCFGAYRGPVMKNAVFGGFTGKEDTAYLNESTAVILTFVVSGEKSDREAVLAWELAFANFMKEQYSDELDISFNCERGLADELDRASHADIMTIVISYILMFVYVSTTLGKLSKNMASCFIQSKVLIGLTGVTLVLVSVTCALGITSYCGLAATLIVIEVVPFLVLAVGVDNVYILVQCLQRRLEETRSRRREPNYVQELMRAVLSEVGPSMLMSTTCQMVAFSLGALSSMPAVQNFAWNATLAVLIDFLLQSSIFVVILTWDTRREINHRVDCVCCVQFPEDTEVKAVQGPVRYFIQNILADMLFSPSQVVRPLVVSLFLLLSLTSLVLIPYTTIGLDESLALPSDSHLVHYFHDVFKYLRIGPEIDFVFRSSVDGRSLNVFDPKIKDILVEADNSLYRIMERYSKDPNEKYITGAVGSWLTTFSDDWLNGKFCCRTQFNDSSQFCASSDTTPDCEDSVKCNKDDEQRMYQFLRWYLSDIPEPEGCTFGGKAQYGSAVSLTPSAVYAGYFTVSHPALSGSEDFISSRLAALRLAHEFNTAHPEVTVFPYSLAYHFYEQYDTIIRETAMNLTICVVATFVVSLIMLGFQLYPALVVMVTVSMVMVDMLGVMVVWGIELNAISLVNLIMSVGIAVEFSAHIVKSYAGCAGKSDFVRARHALVTTGPSVFSGISLTKFVGIVVLAFAKSKLFEVFYFRMFLSVIVLGVMHSLLFLPALLAL